MPSIPVLVIASLAAAWFWMLGVPLIKSMVQRDRSDSVTDFNRQLTHLSKAPIRSLDLQRGRMGQASSRFSPSAWRAQPARSRRRQVFMALCIAAVTSAVLGFAFGGIFWALHITMDVLLAGFVVVAARFGAIEVERRQKVTFIDDRRPAARDVRFDDYDNLDDDFYRTAADV